MNKSLSINIPFNHKMIFRVVRVQLVDGLNSTVDPDNDKHIIMWDFDDSKLKELIDMLQCVQVVYELSDIYIYHDGKDKSYRAICFDIVPFNKLMVILLTTEGVDKDFIKWTMSKGYATQRISCKRGRYCPELLTILHNQFVDTPPVPYYMNFVKYETVDADR